jgi:tRNA(Ile)-lysidine synthase
MLGFTRAEIRAEAERFGVGWLEDPSNLDLRFDRNFLRAVCLPRLVERWPRAGPLADRLARQMAEAESVLGDVAMQDLAGADDPARLPIAPLAELSEARLNNALRHAVGRLGLPTPSSAQLAEIRRSLAARPDAEAVVRWPGGEARRFRGHLYLLVPEARPQPAGGRLVADGILAVADGELRLVATAGYGIPDRWAREGLNVTFRAGGERFRPRESRHHKTLKRWFQETGVVPWMRSSVPLLYRGERLVAVADMTLAAELPQTELDAPFWRPVWTGHPCVF